MGPQDIKIRPEIWIQVHPGVLVSNTLSCGREEREVKSVTHLCKSMISLVSESNSLIAEKSAACTKRALFCSGAGREEA